jgi:outer membrane lipoprotein LolB
MRRRAWIAALLGAGLMVGCATGPTVTPADTDHRWSGRLALTIQEDTPQHFSALFDLQGHPGAGEIRLTSPFGQLLGIARWSASEAELIRGNDRQRYANMDDLTTALTGTALPMSALFQWLNGQPATLDGWQADLSRHADGRIQAQRFEPTPRVQLRLVMQ